MQFAAVATCRITGVTTTAPGNVNQTGWGNFEWNCPGQAAPAGFGSGTRTFNNFTVANTGAAYFHFTGGGANTTTINGNLTIIAGAEAHSYSQVSGSSATPIVNGNLVVNGTFELHNNNFGGASFQTWQVLGDVSIGATGIVRRTSSTNARIQMAGTVDRVLTMAAGGTFTSGLLEINKTSGAKVALGSNVTLSGLAFLSGNLEITGGRILTYTGTTSPTRTSGHVAIGVGSGNAFRWNAPGATAIGTFDFHVGPIGAITGYRRIRLQNFTTPAGTPSITVGYTNNPGTSPTNATSIRSTPSNVISSRIFQDLTFSGGTFGTGDLTLEADIANDFFNGPILAVDMDIFKAPPGPQAWQFIGSGPFNGVNAGNTTVSQNAVVFASGLNRLALGRSNLLDLGTPQFLTWTGLVSTDWSNPANWVPSQIPSAFNQKVTIPNTVRKPVYSGTDPLVIRSLAIGLGAALTYYGDVSLDSAFTNSGTFHSTGLFTMSGANFTGPPAAAIFNFGGTGGTTTVGGWLVTNTSTSGVVVVSPTQKLVILDSLKLNASAKLNLNGTSLTLRSGASKTAKIGVIPGTATLSGASNVTWQRFVSSNTSGWYFLGTPIQGQTLSNWGDNFDIFLPLALPNVYNISADHANLYEFDGTISPTGAHPSEVNGWRIPTSGPVAVGKGFRAYLRSPGFLSNQKIFDNTGLVTQGDFTFNTPFNAAGYNGGGWSFLANPYPAALNWDAPSNPANWTKTNVNNAIYIWNGTNGQYMSYVSGVGTNGGTNIIPAGQGFFIHHNAGAVLTARENVKFSGTGSFARITTQTAILRIKLRNEQNKTDEAILRSSPGGSSAFDPDFDAFKLPGTFVNLGIGSTSNTLSVQTIDHVSEDLQVPLWVDGKVGSHEISFEGVSAFSGGYTMYLKDNYLGILEVVNENTKYSFEITTDAASLGHNRFELVFSPETLTEIKTVEEGKNWKVYPNPNLTGSFTLIAPVQADGVVSIVDLKGKVVYEQFADLRSGFTFKASLSPGIYQLVIKTNRSNWNQKLVVQ